MYKYELANAAGVSMSVMRKWISETLSDSSFYNKRNQLLSPAYVKNLCEKYCIDLE
jgi:hypothetical protein